MMSGILHGLGELTLLTAAIRLLLATVLGGIIGMERGRRGRAAGMRTMYEDGLVKAMQGVTTIEEVLRVTQEN